MSLRLDVESLRALKLVVETGGFTSAAETLHLTQSAVSWKLKRLEEKIGWPLIRREGRAVALTEHGRELIEYADRILSAHDEAVQRFQVSDLSGTVRFGATDDIAAYRLARVAGRFRRIHPSVKLQLRVDMPLTLLEWLEHGEIELAVTPAEEDKVLRDDILLWRDQLVWAQSKDGNFASYDSVPLVTFGPKCFYRDIAARLLTAASIPFDVVLECPSVAGVQAAVSSGVGVALINSLFMTPTHCRWPVGSQVPDPPAVRYVIRAARFPLGPIERSLATEIQEALANGEYLPTLVSSTG